jgi:MYXO-CTERM domain-containing protein
MRLLVAALILPAVVVLGIATFETRIFYPPPSNGPTRGIVWGGHTFATRVDFTGWLRSRGVPYRVWAERHPVRAGLTARRLAKQAAQRKAENRGGQRKVSRWRLGTLGGGAAFLAVLGLGVVFVRRRRRNGGSQSPRRSFERAPRRAGATAAPRAQLRARRVDTATAWTTAPTLLRMRRTPERILGSLDPAAHRAAAGAEAGARLTMRGVTAIGLLTMRGASATALRSLILATSAASVVRQKHTELAWNLATAFLYLVAAVGVIAWVVVILVG